MLATLLVVAQLVFLEGVLSLDNAAVIAAMSRHLPEDVPAPKPFGFLGSQRQAALKAGLIGGIVGRGTMLFLAGWIASIPALKVAGAAYLGYLAARHFVDLYRGNAEGHEEGGASRKASAGFWGVVLSIELADIAFSVDNVLAAVALSDKLWVVMLGCVIGMIAMRFAASAFQWLMARVPEMEHGAYLLIAAIAVEMGLKMWHVEIGEIAQFAISAAIVLGTVIYSRLRRRATAPVSVPVPLDR